MQPRNNSLPLPYVRSYGLVITTNADHELAHRFLELAATAEWQQELAAASGRPPASRAAVASTDLDLRLAACGELAADGLPEPPAATVVAEPWRGAAALRRCDSFSASLTRQTRRRPRYRFRDVRFGRER